MLTIETHNQAQPAIFTGSMAKIENRLKIIQDNSLESPREWDNMGTMYCEHRRYNLGDKNAQDISVYNYETEQRETPDKGYTILPLYLYDHSGITMSTGRFSCPWDSGCVGYIYFSDKDAKENYGWKIITKKRREIIAKHLKAEVETYDQYLTGDVYGFEFESVAVYPDGREEVQDTDSCCGFYGSDPEKNGMADCLIVDIKDCEVTTSW